MSRQISSRHRSPPSTISLSQDCLVSVDRQTRSFCFAFFFVRHFLVLVSFARCSTVLSSPEFCLGWHFPPPHLPSFLFLLSGASMVQHGTNGGQ